MADTETKCPQCSCTDLCVLSVVVATLPPGSIRPGRVLKVVERKRRCLECQHEFSTIEQWMGDDA